MQLDTRLAGTTPAQIQAEYAGSKALPKFHEFVMVCCGGASVTLRFTAIDLGSAEHSSQRDKHPTTHTPININIFQINRLIKDPAEERMDARTV